MKKRRKIKKQVYIIFSILIIIMIAIICIINYIKLINSNPYKLEKLGYNDEQITTILTLKDKYVEDVLNTKFNKNIPNFINQDYFLYKNLDKYLLYYKENSEDKLSHVVSMVNVNANYEWYDKDVIKNTDVSKGNLMLVNKFNQLLSSYVPENIVSISNYYSYAGNSIVENVYEAYKDMWYTAKEKDLTLIVTSSYRDFKTQDALWNQYSDSKSEEYADSISARAGFSEHQSGLALDIVTYNVTLNNFEVTDEFTWLQENAYKYGFILRYPKDKTDITGYDYESWHYRYVGIDVATTIHEKNITFDEYYAYYIIGDK